MGENDRRVRLSREPLPLYPSVHYSRGSFPPRHHGPSGVELCANVDYTVTGLCPWLLPDFGGCATFLEHGPVFFGVFSFLSCAVYIGESVLFSFRLLDGRFIRGSGFLKHGTVILECL